MTDVNLKYDFNERPSSVLQAMMAWDYDSAHALITEYADLDERSLFGDTALLLAVRYNKVDIYKELIQFGADVNTQTAFGVSPLHVAAQNNNVPAIEYLLKNGADINIQDGWGRTPLYIAATNNHREAVELLLSHRPKVNEMTTRNETAYYSSNEYGYHAIALLLEKAGADTTLEPGEFDEGRSAFVSVLGFG